MLVAALAGYLSVILSKHCRGSLRSWWPVLILPALIAGVVFAALDIVGIFVFLLTLGGDSRSLLLLPGSALCFVASRRIAVWSDRPRSAKFYATCCIGALWLAMKFID